MFHSGTSDVMMYITHHSARHRTPPPLFRGQPRPPHFAKRRYELPTCPQEEPVWGGGFP